MEIWFGASVTAHDFVSSSFWAARRQATRDVYLPASETWVAESAGNVVGFVSLRNDKVEALFVSREQQSRGIGSMLLEHAKSVRQALTLDVFEKNVGARTFYERHGFVITARNRHADTGEDNVVMVGTGTRA